MPWHREAMKDVARCEKLRGECERLVDPEISEWGNPPFRGYRQLNP